MLNTITDDAHSHITLTSNQCAELLTIPMFSFWANAPTRVLTSINVHFGSSLEDGEHGRNVKIRGIFVVWLSGRPHGDGVNCESAQ